MTPTADRNRYARDWNGYSEHWDRSYGGKYAHLGDESIATALQVVQQS